MHMFHVSYYVSYYAYVYTCMYEYVYTYIQVYTYSRVRVLYPVRRPQYAVRSSQSMFYADWVNRRKRCLSVGMRDDVLFYYQNQLFRIRARLFRVSCVLLEFNPDSRIHFYLVTRPEPVVCLPILTEVPIVWKKSISAFCWMFIKEQLFRNAIVIYQSRRLFNFYKASCKQLSFYT